jgi:hypothetical protein
VTQGGVLGLGFRFDFKVPCLLACARQQSIWVWEVGAFAEEQVYVFHVGHKGKNKLLRRFWQAEGHYSRFRVNLLNRGRKHLQQKISQAQHVFPCFPTVKSKKGIQLAAQTLTSVMRVGSLRMDYLCRAVLTCFGMEFR